MKTMIRTTAALLFTSSALLGLACVEDSEDGDQLRMTEAEQIVENLRIAGFPEDDIGVTADGVVYVGQDAVVTMQASREMAGIFDDVEGPAGAQALESGGGLLLAVALV